MKIPFAGLYLDLTGFGASLLRTVHSASLLFLLSLAPPASGNPISVVTMAFIIIVTGHLWQVEWKEITLASCGAILLVTAYLIDRRRGKQSHVAFQDCLHHNKYPK